MGARSGCERPLDPKIEGPFFFTSSLTLALQTKSSPLYYSYQRCGPKILGDISLAQTKNSVAQRFGTPLTNRGGYLQKLRPYMRKGVLRIPTQSKENL